MFLARFASMTKQCKISNRLDAIKLEDVREEEGDDYVVLEKLTRRINQLASMARIMDKDDEAKIRFLNWQ